MSTPRWLTEAEKYIGEREVKGAKHNPLILRWWMAIRAPFTNDETPWCAGYVGGVLEAVGIKSSRSAAARSYLNWGRSITPTPGAILVFERGPKYGHVAFYLYEDTLFYYVLGGNQGDAVGVMKIAKSRLLGSRWPLGEPLPTLGRVKKTDASIVTSTNEA